MDSVEIKTSPTYVKQSIALDYGEVDGISQFTSVYWNRLSAQQLAMC